MHRIHHRFATAMAAVFGALLLLPVQAAAQGWIAPRQQQQQVEKLRSTVTVRVTGRVAHVQVEEWFRNNGGGLAEGDYVYPLPAQAVFSSYSLYQGDQELRGEMMDGARAREIYERIVRERRDPALIELVGKGMVRARVFPFEGGQTRRITLRYTQVLDRAGDALQFRYAAGAVQSVPVALTMTVDSAVQFRNAFSPTHPLDVQRARGAMTVRPRGTLAGDITVFLPLAARPVGITVATHHPAGDDGYVMMTLSPGAAAEARVPRDVTVVVDVSGSMSGEKIEQARGAVRQLLGTLTAADRFRLIAFSSGVRPWRDEWTPATTAELRSAHLWADRLQAEGGTNIHAALESAFAARTPASRLPVVIFMTDGLPTNGETDVERIAAMAEAGRDRARVFAFGVGFDVNTHLLDRLSEAARGSTQYVRPGEDVEQAMGVLAARIRHPVLTDLALETSGIRIEEVYPRALPDLFADEDLVLFGRYRAAAAGRVTVTGQRSGRAERYATQVVLPARSEANAYMPRLWASRKLGDLDRRIRSAQADGADAREVTRMIEELRRTALQYGLLSEYTSYLVQEPGMVASTGAGATGGMRPQMLQSAVQAAPPPQSGRVAVARAEEARRARATTTVAEMEALQVTAAARLAPSAAANDAAAGAPAAQRVVAGRTYILRADVWQDVRHDASRRVIHVEPYSDAYFALLRALPELTLAFRELETALVAGERLSVRVAPGGVKQLSAAQVTSAVAEFRP